MLKPDLNKKLQVLQDALTKATNKLEAAKTEKDKADAKNAIEAIKKQIADTQTAIEEAVVNAGISTEINDNDSKGLKKAKNELAMMNKYKVNQLFVNKQGHYFLSQNLAELSVKDKKEVKTLTREIVESQIK